MLLCAFVSLFVFCACLFILFSLNMFDRAKWPGHSKGARRRGKSSKVRGARERETDMTNEISCTLHDTHTHTLQYTYSSKKHTINSRIFIELKSKMCVCLLSLTVVSVVLFPFGFVLLFFSRHTFVWYTHCTCV